MGKNNNSVQELLGIRSFSRYGLLTDHGELLFFAVSPTNISVLSAENIQLKIQKLQMVLSSIPQITIVCKDAAERFDANMAYLHLRQENESNPSVRLLLQQDMDALDVMQSELSAARQFFFTIKADGKSERQTFDRAAEVQKIIADQGFEVHLMHRDEIKKMLAIYLGSCLYGDQLADSDGAEYLQKGQMNGEVKE